SALPHLSKYSLNDILACTLRFTILLSAPASKAQSVASPAAPDKNSPEKVIIDTHIGDDIDDAFAVALALRSPEMQIMGITTTFGDTEARAKIVDRMLGEVGRQDIAVAMGAPTHGPNPISQRSYGNGGHFARSCHPAALEFV